MTDARRAIPTAEFSTRLQALVDRHGLPNRAFDQLSSFLDLLVGDPLAPTSIRDPLGAIDDHLADSLVALDLPIVRSAGSIADLGSGAGLPGIVLAIARPETEVALVESSTRKSGFISRALAACELRNAQTVNARAEAWPDGLEQFDVVTARALASLPVVAEYAAPLLRLGGALVAWRGRRDLEAEEAATRAALELGLEMEPPFQVHPYAGTKHRYLQVMSKVRDTPSRFPRRPGMAVKRPLGTARTQGRATTDAPPPESGDRRQQQDRNPSDRFQR